MTNHEATAKAFFGSYTNDGVIGIPCDHNPKKLAVTCWDCGPKQFAAALASAEGGAMDRSAVYYGEVIAQLRAKLKDEHDEAEHYRLEASNVYLANENIQEEVAQLRAKLEEAEREEAKWIENHCEDGVKILNLEAKLAEAERNYKHDHQLALDQASIVIEANTECNRLKAERDNLRAKLADTDQICNTVISRMNELKAERDAAEAAIRDTHDLAHEKITQLEGAAFVRGLERAKEIEVWPTGGDPIERVGFAMGVDAKNDAIAAEIAKAGK